MKSFCVSSLFQSLIAGSSCDRHAITQVKNSRPHMLAEILNVGAIASAFESESRDARTVHDAQRHAQNAKAMTHVQNRPCVCGARRLQQGP